MKEKLKEKIHVSTLFFYISGTVLAGIVALTAVLCILNVRLSKEVFLENFSESQNKIFKQIDSEFYSFYRDMADVLNSVSANESVRRYISGDFENQVEERKFILGTKKAVEQSVFSNYPECNMLFVGMDGKTFIYNWSDRTAVSSEEIMDSEISREVLENPLYIASKHMESGFTDTMKNTPVIMFAKAIRSTKSEETEGIVYITMKEENFRKMYSYFTSDTSDILIFNRNQELLSTNDENYFTDKKYKQAEKLLQYMEEEGIQQMTTENGGKVRSYQIQRFQNTNYKMLGILDPEAAFENSYNLGQVLGITVLISFLVVAAIWYVLRLQTRPLYHLVSVMSKVGEGNLEEYAKESGTADIKQLSRTYNRMLKEINHYVDEIYRAEGEKRMAEIHALQMQINPHYIYNTLASIKWLVWQGETQKTAKVIDSFISLLRNTISNTDEFVTVEQEIENLRNYVFINQVRYGENVEVEYFVAPDCLQYKLPKLILQPFVENAFFHAFPEGRTGFINVFVKEENGQLRFDIVDNGVGINQETLLSIRNKEKLKGEHFTGIGVNNVDDRIKMIYGMNYGINIISEKDQGTSITILFPLKK